MMPLHAPGPHPNAQKGTGTRRSDRRAPWRSSSLWDMQERWAGTWGSNLHDLRIQGKLLTGFEEF